MSVELCIVRALEILTKLGEPRGVSENNSQLDRQAVEELVYKYCYYFDRNQPQELSELFSIDAVVDYGPEISNLTSRKQIFEMVSKGLAETFLATSHHISNFMITSQSNSSATSTSYVYAWHKYRSKEEIGHLWGGYEHEFIKIEGKWFIKNLKLFGVGLQDFHRNTMHSNGRK
jgi:SnoaL-like domain